MRIKKFIAFNIIMSLIELSLVLLLVNLLCSNIILYIMITLYIVLFSYQIIKTSKTDIFQEVDVKNNQFTKYQSLIEETKKIKPDLKYKYIKLDEIPNPAFYFKNTVYINTNALIEPEFFEGMLAHELGHATTSLGDVVNISVLRLSTIISNFMFMIRFRIKDKKTISFKIFDAIYYVLFLIISLPDILVLNNFIREDEYLANSYAQTITNSRSLRAYYYKAYKNSDPQKTKYDLKHPKVIDMISKMEENMDLSTHEQKIYAVGKKVYYVKATSIEEKHQLIHNYYLHCLPLDKDIAYKLSLNYERGIGTEKSVEKQKEYLYIATEFHHPNAARKLATIYKQENNIEEATKYYLMYATYDKKAYYQLGLLYEETDLDQAIHYYKQGAELNDKSCLNKIKQLEIIEEENVEN